MRNHWPFVLLVLACSGEPTSTVIVHPEPACTPGHQRCSEQFVQRCDADGVWQLEQTCEICNGIELCRQQNETQAECLVPNCCGFEMRCADGQLQQCSSLIAGWELAPDPEGLCK